MKKVLSIALAFAAIICTAHVAGAIDIFNISELFSHVANGAPISFAALGVAGYWDAAGQWRSPEGRAVGGSIAIDANSNGGYSGNCGPKGNYTFPPQITFVMAGGVAGAVNKFTQADNMTEALIGEIGTVWPTIAELPFGDTGIAKQDGTDIFGAETLARALQTYGLKIGAMQLTGAAAGVSVLNIDAWRANLTGANQEKWTLNLDPNNNTGNVILRMDKPIDLTSNVSFRVAVPAAGTYTLTMYVLGVIPYA